MNYPILALIVANIIWGAASPIFKWALSDIPPFTLAFYRFLGGALLILPFALPVWKKITLRDFLMIVTAAFFGLTLNIGLFFLGLQRGLSIDATIIASGGPVILFILAVLFLHERPQKKVFAGMSLSFLGVCVIVISPLLNGMKSVSQTEFIGNLFFIGAVLGALLDPLISKQVLKRVHSLQLSTIAFTFTALTFFPLMLNESRSWSITQIHVEGIVGLVFGIFLSTVVAYVLFLWGLSKIKAQEIGLFTYIDPVIALLIAVPLLGEYPHKFYFIGAILVFGGIFIAEKRIHWHPLQKLKS